MRRANCEVPDVSRACFSGRGGVSACSNVDIRQLYRWLFDVSEGR